MQRNVWEPSKKDFYPELRERVSISILEKIVQAKGWDRVVEG